MHLAMADSFEILPIYLRQKSKIHLKKNSYYISMMCDFPLIICFLPQEKLLGEIAIVSKEVFGCFLRFFDSLIGWGGGHIY